MAYEITPGFSLSLKSLPKKIFSMVGLLSFQAAGKGGVCFLFVCLSFFLFFPHKVHHRENLLSTLETYNNYFWTAQVNFY